MSIQSVDAMIEGYLQALQRELPGSSAQRWDQPPARRRITDDKLLRMLELAEAGKLFRHCRPIHFQVLMAKVARICVRTKMFIGGESPSARPLTSKETAKALGISHRTYRARLQEANVRVLLALDKALAE